MSDTNPAILGLSFNIFNGSTIDGSTIGRSAMSAIHLLLSRLKIPLNAPIVVNLPTSSKIFVCLSSGRIQIAVFFVLFFRSACFFANNNA